MHWHAIFLLTKKRKAKMTEVTNKTILISGPLHAEKPLAINPQEQRMKELKARVREDCRILYPGGKPCWECGIGWADALAKLSYKIECANRLFSRNFRVHAEADQVKEKFGGLRFYYTVHRDAPPIIKRLGGFLRKFADIVLRKADFRTKRVTIKPATVTIKCEELPPPSLSDNSMYAGKLLEAPDGFRCLLNKVHQYEVSKQVPTRLRPLWHIAYACYKVESWLLDLYFANLNRQIIGMEALEDFIEKAIKEAEDACYSTCEECGNSIGTNYSPRCETLGWITYICERCAKKRGVKYQKGNDIYKNGEFIESVKKPEYGERSEDGC